MTKDRAFHEAIELICKARVVISEQVEDSSVGRFYLDRQVEWLRDADRLLKTTDEFIPPISELLKWEQERRAESGRGDSLIYAEQGKSQDQPTTSTEAKKEAVS